MLNQEELRMLGTVFMLARQACVNDESRLLEVISFRRAIFKKLEDNNKPKQVKTENT